MTTFKHPTIKSNDELVRAVDHQKVRGLIALLARIDERSGWIAPEAYMHRTHAEMTRAVNDLAGELKLLDMTTFYIKQLQRISEAKSLEEATALAAAALQPSVTP